ncbi:competence protein ComEA [Parafrankia irregularis]|uniref:Competence protein ComEA n=1 Tax=Parafrankia irregularis TaxID=795642 RepID=A0A0S4QED7_9ACTN|nr:MULTISPECIES: ComEA family DNA-binding protein [Parafrankia]MBE3199496.1 ComEA family DNA-binding protein [Parafrankia sp. CH37]CUU53841.1 competence protein ComEA [Parafrankia irregularis]
MNRHSSRQGSCRGDTAGGGTHHVGGGTHHADHASQAAAVHVDDAVTEPLGRSWPAFPPSTRHPGRGTGSLGELDAGWTGSGSDKGSDNGSDGWSDDWSDLDVDGWSDEWAGGRSIENRRQAHPEDLGDRDGPEASGDPDDAGHAGGAGGRRGLEGHDRRGRHRQLSDRLPPSLRGAILAPSARAALVLVVVAVAAAATAGWLAWRGRPVELASKGPGQSALVAQEATTTARPAAGFSVSGASAPAVPTSSSGHPAGTESEAGQEIVVDVAGRVARPGVVRLPAGSRVVDALTLAGGALPGTDTTGLALARVLTDGEQILVDGRAGPAPPLSGSGQAAAGAAGGAGSAAGGGQAPLDLNAATASQLDELPGVGPVLAQRIVDWRAANGPFTSADQLGEVTGVGDRRLADLLPLVTV